MRHLPVAILLAALTAHEAAAQTVPAPVPAEVYLTTHLWGSPSVVNGKHAALGDASVADALDSWHANPAAATSIAGPTLFGAYGYTSLGALPGFHTTTIGYAQRVHGERITVKSTASLVRASGTASGIGGLRMEASENDVGLEFAGRPVRGFSIGGGTAYLSTHSRFILQPVGVLTELRSRPSGVGGRGGMLFDRLTWLSAGVSVDYYRERVTQKAELLGVPDNRARFRSAGYRAGVAVRPGHGTLILGEREKLTVRGPAGTVFDRHVWKAGVEQRIGQVALRGGLFGSRPTAGVAVRLAHAELSYVITNRFDRDLPAFDAHPQQLLQLIHRLR